MNGQEIFLNDEKGFDVTDTNLYYIVAIFKIAKTGIGTDRLVACSRKSKIDPIV